MRSQWCASTDYIEIKRPADREKQRCTSDETQREQYKSAIQWWISTRWFCSSLSQFSSRHTRVRRRSGTTAHSLSLPLSLMVTVNWKKMSLLSDRHLKSQHARKQREYVRSAKQRTVKESYLNGKMRERSLWLMSAQVEISTSRFGRNVTTDAQWQMDRQEQKLPFPGLHNHTMAASKWHCLIIGTGCCCAYFDSSQNSTGCEQWRLSLSLSLPKYHDHSMLIFFHEKQHVNEASFHC